MFIELTDAEFCRWEKDLKMLTKCLKDLGLVVNKVKTTELCLFNRRATHMKELELNETIILSKNQKNVLGVTFESGPHRFLMQ